MQLHNTLVIRAPVDDVWVAMTDAPSIAPCIPGAEIESDLGDGRYAGRVRVRLGPLALELVGELAFETIDPVAKSISLKATGRDHRGLGHADATILVSALADGRDTSLDIVTDLRLGGPVAQFGRQGIVTQVASSLLDRFGSCLAEHVTADDHSRPRTDRVSTDMRDQERPR